MKYDTEIPESWRPIAVEDDQRVMEIPTPSPPGHPGGTALSDSEKAEELADSLETQFQPVIAQSAAAALRKLTCSWSPTY